MQMFLVIKSIIISTENSDEDDICFSLSEMDINEATGENEETYCESDDVESEDKYIPSGKKNDKIKLFNQKELNDLIRELIRRLIREGLPKDGAELLASRLKERNLLTKGTKVSFYRTKYESFRKYFTQDHDLVYCNDVTGLINELKEDIYKSDNWRLFIDFSTQSLKAVLLHNTNKYAPIPIVYSVTLKED